VSAATFKSSSAALVIAIIFIVDQHVRAPLGQNHVLWLLSDIKKAIVDGSSTPNVSGVTEIVEKLK
jgi:hypothetical protein